MVEFLQSSACTEQQMGGDGRMLKLKGCPRCRGDIIVDRDHHGWYEQCLQCGYQHDLKSVVKVERRPIQEVRKLQ